MEYAYSFLATAALVLRARRKGKLAVLQACNPPDIFWPIARWLRRRDGTRFVFDHHDLCPELYDSRFPDGRTLPKRGLLALERATFRTADHVVATNTSYAEIAMGRAGARPQTTSRWSVLVPTKIVSSGRQQFPHCGVAESILLPI